MKKKTKNTTCTNKDRVFCYFHCDDLDGFSSASVVQKEYPDADFYGYNYERHYPIVSGYDKVFMVDCSIPAKDMAKLKIHNKEFIWIDHHERTTKEIEKHLHNIKGLRDSKHSACVLTWKYVYGDLPVPVILKSIEDFDIWKWKIPYTDEINTALFIDYKSREKLIPLLKYHSFESIKHIIDLGKTYINMRDSQVNFLKSLMRVKDFHGHNTAFINTPMHGSQLGSKILMDNPDIEVVFMWYNFRDIIRVSLRSRSIDVSELASKYGGGGHRLASGFSVNANDTKLRNVFLW